MSKIKRFAKKLVNDVYWGIGNPDEPKCPHCPTMMKFHGDADNLKIGEGYWECPNCGFKYDENELDYNLVEDNWY